MITETCEKAVCIYIILVLIYISKNKYTAAFRYMAILIGLAALVTALGSSLSLIMQSMKFRGCTLKSSHSHTGVDELLNGLLQE